MMWMKLQFLQRTESSIHSFVLVELHQEEMKRIKQNNWNKLKFQVHKIKKHCRTTIISSQKPIFTVY